MMRGGVSTRNARCSFFNHHSSVYGSSRNSSCEGKKMLRNCDDVTEVMTSCNSKITLCQPYRGSGLVRL